MNQDTKQTSRVTTALGSSSNCQASLKPRQTLHDLRRSSRTERPNSAHSGYHTQMFADVEDEDIKRPSNKVARISYHRRVRVVQVEANRTVSRKEYQAELQRRFRTTHTRSELRKSDEE